MRDAVHQVLVDDVADALLLGGGISGAGVGDSLGDLACGLGVERALDELGRGLNGQALGNANVDLRLASKALGIHVLVGRDDDSLCLLDLGGSDLVLNADLAVGLDLDGQALGCCRVLQGLLGHEGVGDARGAARCGYDVVCHATSFPLLCLRHILPSGASAPIHTSAQRCWYHVAAARPCWSSPGCPCGS